MNQKALAKIFIFAMILVGLQLTIAGSSASNLLTKSDFARYFCEYFEIKDGPEISFLKM